MRIEIDISKAYTSIDTDISKAYTSIDTDAHGKQPNSQIARPSHKTQTHRLDYASKAQDSFLKRTRHNIILG